MKKVFMIHILLDDEFQKPPVKKSVLLFDTFDALMKLITYVYSDVSYTFTMGGDGKGRVMATRPNHLNIEHNIVQMAHVQELFVLTEEDIQKHILHAETM